MSNNIDDRIHCKACDSSNVHITYHGPIRVGLHNETEKEYDVFRCENCGLLWHENDYYSSKEYYESEEYRNGINETTSLNDYHNRHDEHVIDFLNCIGTKVFRDKIVADIGCGGGSFLDYVSGAASKAIAIEPNVSFRRQLASKYETYAYASDAFAALGSKADVVTSFDVIEHVESPASFLKDVYNLMANDGVCYIGTPTESRHLRELVGSTFDRFYFSVQHPWVLSACSLQILFKNAGFNEILVTPIHMYGLGNVMAWLKYGQPKGQVTFDCISATADAVWKSEMCSNGYSDYLVVSGRK